MKPHKSHAFLALGLASLLALAGCRGQASQKPPLWIKHGMEFQPKALSYARSKFTSDGRAMRMPPEGTVAVGLLKEDDIFWRGGKDTSSLVATNPLRITTFVMERGQERFNIYCTPCHGATGVGDGLVIKRGFTPPPNFHDDRIVGLPDGYIFNVISHGIRTMPSYGKQVPEEDRWAIVAYIRALQRSQRATLNDVPESERANLR
ncbi:MAG TPA: cytochrome c [Fibrobacteria bacterium]|nr:cytochrome c [Fibrobacteria bacterium]